MEAQTALEIVFAALVLVVAYAVRGTTGFGGQAIAVPLIALMLPLQAVVPALTALTALSSFTYWRRDRHNIEWGEIGRLLPFTLLGVAAGLYVFQQVDPRTLTKAFGAFVILYALFSLRPAGMASPPSRLIRPLGALLSATSGALGAIFGAAAGPLYVIYFNMLHLDKERFRATVTTILMFQAVARVAGYARLGFYDQTVLLLIAAGLPMMLIGARLGGLMAGRIEQHLFNRCVAALLLLSGVALLLK
nr:putative membrane protein [uncultured bacterium]